MATQSTKVIRDLTLQQGTIEQMRVRIGLKCGEDDARYLFTDRNDVKALELMKGPIGTAVLNQEYMESSNVGFRTAYFNCNASNNSLPNPFDESDHFISGSLQNRLGHRCYVFGTENNISNKFTGHQGNNAFGIENNCGIACVTQLLILSGKRIVENDVVRTAVGCGLCEITGMQLQSNGATSAEQRKILLDKHGIRSTIKILSSEQIANYIERGHGIIVSVDAGVLWKKPEYVGVGHAIMAYGTIHKYDTGKLIGLIICDTGSGEMEFPLPIVLFDQMYNFERGANVTLEAIR